MSGKMPKRIDNLDEFLTGNLQRDSLNYLGLDADTQTATLSQIANDFVQLHRIQQAEQRLGTDLAQSKLSAVESMAKQKLSVEQIAKDLVELQMKLASMGNYYTLSFLERCYKHTKSINEDTTNCQSLSQCLSTKDSELTQVSPLDEAHTTDMTTASSSRSSSRQLGSSIRSASALLLSDMEQAILSSNEPIAIDESDMISVNGEKGIWMNKHETSEWKGDLSLSDYAINEDLNPEIIVKKSEEVLEYVQELAIRYLRPDTPPPAGDIIITQEPDSQAPPAPPIIIRQAPVRPETPEPLVIREAPPEPPAYLEPKIIKISGKQLPPQPRRVIIERLAALPNKPQPVVIERWLPYPKMKRQVVFNRPSDMASQKSEKNLIIQWNEPAVTIKKEFRYLGSIKAEPSDYKQTYGSDLKDAKDLPDIVNEFERPDGLVLAAEQKAHTYHELDGDVFALKMLDLKKEGLDQYAYYLNDSESRRSVMSTLSLATETSSIEQQAEKLDKEIVQEL